MLLNDLWGKMIDEVSESRNLPVDSLNAYADRLMDLQPAQEYVTCGLVDTLLYRDEVRNYLKQLSGRSEDENLRTLLLEDMVNVRRNVPKDKSGNVIAVYYACGEIDLNGGLPFAGAGDIDSKKVAKDLRRLREDKNIRAIVLRAL